MPLSKINSSNHNIKSAVSCYDFPWKLDQKKIGVIPWWDSLGDKFNFFISNVLKWVSVDIVLRGFFTIACEDFFGQRYYNYWE